MRVLNHDHSMDYDERDLSSEEAEGREISDSLDMRDSFDEQGI